MSKLPRCQRCDVEIAEPWLCARCQREIDTPIRLPIPVERPRAEATPTYGIHVAGRLVNHEQRCALCGELLAADLARKYPEGALVERGRGWQAMKMSGEPTCCAQQTNAKRSA